MLVLKEFAISGHMRALMFKRAATISSQKYTMGL